MERAVLRRVCLVLFAAMLAACSCARRPSPPADAAAEVGPDQISVKVTGVGFDDFSQAHYVMLSSSDDEHQLPIMIGESEAGAITRALHGQKAERPLTNDLMKSIIEGTGGQVDCISIFDVRDEVYIAAIYLNRGEAKIDSRPSDAIALAASVGAPIFVASKLFDEGTRRGVGTQPQPETATAVGITVEELTPILAAYFHAPRGVLVTEVVGDAAREGIERGDIITAVGTRQVNAPAEFGQIVTADRGSALVLRVNHDGAERNVSIAR